MKISPIAEYLRINKAKAKKDKFGCHFVSPQGLYLGRMTKAIVNNYRVITLDVLGEGLKKMYTKSVALGQQYVYVKNSSSSLGISLAPIKTYMRKVVVDFVEGKSTIEDSEKTLSNKLDLIAIDEATGVGLYDMDKPFLYKTKIINNKTEKLKNPIYTYNEN